ncbi:6-bladed beta-propeller [bacterium]|nr:6-bladed beta-propeller [bacterium]
MKNTIRIIPIVLFLSASILFVSCQKQKAEWKGQIKTVDGVTILENPKTPMYEQPVLILSADLRIGEEESRPDYLFFRVSSIAIDREENIYVTDEGEKHIKVFNREGVHLRTIGRPGQGPGEIGHPSEIFITMNNELTVTDLRRRELHSLSNEGRYLGSKKFNTVFPLEIARDSKGYYYVMNWMREPGSRSTGFDLLTFDSSLEIVSTLVKVEISPQTQREDFDQIPEFAIRKDDCLVFGYSGSYTFKILSPDGEVMRIIKKKYNMIPIPDEVKKMARERDPNLTMEFPKYYRPFFNFFLDDSGRLFVLTHGDNVAESIYNCDVFDPEGRFICKIPLKLMEPFVMILTGDKIYLVDEDSEGNPFIRRYSVTWKYK